MTPRKNDVKTARKTAEKTPKNGPKILWITDRFPHKPSQCHAVTPPVVTPYPYPYPLHRPARLRALGRFIWPAAGHPYGRPATGQTRKPPPRPEGLPMPAPTNAHRAGAVFAALDMPEHVPPAARLWLALASMRTDDKGRTQFGPAGYARATNDTEAHGQAAIEWLTRAGWLIEDHDEAGIECWRLTHHQWDNTRPTIGGYSRDAGMVRDGLPPQYGRGVADVIEPNGKPYKPVPGGTWRQDTDA